MNWKTIKPVVKTVVKWTVIAGALGIMAYLAVLLIGTAPAIV